MRGTAIVSVVVLSAGALGACGGGGDGDAASTSTTQQAGEATTTTAAGTSSSVQVDASVWFAGFKLDFGEATFTAEPSALVEIATEFNNLGSESATLDATLVLEQGGNGVTSTDLTDVPEVPGGSTGKGTLRFSMAPNFTFDDAVLKIGNPDNNQAVVPLGTTGELVTLEPIRSTVTGEASAGQLSISAHGGELRADIPETHRQVEKEKLALSIGFDVTNSGTGGGGYAFGPDNLALTLPDGTTVAPDDSPIELLGHRSTLKNQTVRFLVDNPAEGDYALLIREGDNEGTVEFTIS
jgi:hypothetical protein